MLEHDLFDIMASTRSMRRLKADPVPDEVIYKILDAGVRAPSGTNTQNWRFLVVKDPEIKKRVAVVYQKGWAQVEHMYDSRPGPEHMEDGKFRRLISAAAYLAQNLAEVPVLLIACLQERAFTSPNLMPPEIAAKLARLSGASVYPAVQNMLLTCRALGVGATLTTVASIHEEELKAVLNLPDEISTYALLPIGYPIGRFGPVNRLPVEEVTCVDQWGIALKK